MSKSPYSYICIRPTKDSRLGLDEVKELLAYLSQDKTGIELIIRSKNAEGIEFFIGISPDKLKAFIKQIYSVSPDLVVSKVKTSEAHLLKPTLDLSYGLSRHYAYPLYDEESLDNEAQIKLMRIIAQLADREEIEVSFSGYSELPLKARILRRRLVTGAQPPVSSKNILVKAGSLTITSLGLLSSMSLFMVSELNPKTRPINRHAVVSNKKSVLLLDKLYQPLFKVGLNIKIKAPSPKRAATLARDIESALNTFASSSGYQRLRPTKRRGIFSAGDLASIFHFEQSGIEADVFKLDHFKTLPPTSNASKLKQPGDIVVGQNTHHGGLSDITLKKADRYRHVYISGATGSGKSTLLANLIVQDMESDQGLTLIDPHGDLAAEVLENIPKDRLKDVIYFDPSDPSSDISINLLETKYKYGSANFKTEADQITESLISLFRKVFGEDLNGHRIEYILRNTIQTSLSIPGSTIFTIYRLLTDSSFRFSVVQKLTNEDLINFWRNELGRAGDYQRVKMTAGVTAKIGRFLFSEPAKRVFGQSKSNLDIAKVMDEGKILICNFSRGLLGEDGSGLFATSLLTKLQLAALARASIPSSERKDHYLYVDEFQSCAPNVLIQMLSEARKYGLYLTMAEQSPSQQDYQSTSIILANVGNLVCFRLASPKDERLLLPSFSEYLSASDLSNLPAYSFYIKTTAESVQPPTSVRANLLDDRRVLKADFKNRKTKKLGRAYKLRRAI